MRSLLTAFLLTLATVQPTRAQPDTTDPLQPGQYHVEVRTELPHVQNLGMDKAATLCVTPARDNAARGLAVLGDNNPLARCPVSDVRHSGSLLTFDIACEGPNAPRASASYALAADSFRGRIEMDMGGKNMTMAEVQVGRRVGTCAP